MHGQVYQRIQGSCTFQRADKFNIFLFYFEVPLMSLSEIHYLLSSSLACSGMIGFILCATEGPPVDFVNPINPIEKLEGANEHKRELQFYNSEVKYMFHMMLLPM